MMESKLSLNKDNFFVCMEEKIFYDETIAFDKDKIKSYLFKSFMNELKSKNNYEKAFYFEKIVYDFFGYRGISLIKTKKTRDFGIDGILKLKLDIFGEQNFGLQIKYKTIDSNDIDLFSSSLKNLELQVGVIVCKDSRNLINYNLNSRIKAILFSRGIVSKEKLINESVSINPVSIIKFGELLDNAALEMRAFVKSIYKK